MRSLVGLRRLRRLTERAASRGEGKGEKGVKREKGVTGVKSVNGERWEGSLWVHCFALLGGATIDELRGA